MNEQIQELAVQSGLKVESWMTNPPKPFQILGSAEEFEKFAELIVRECMSMCDETQANYLKHRKATIDFDEKNIFAEGEAASDVIKYKMKKHFGVEE